MSLVRKLAEYRAVRDVLHDAVVGDITHPQCMPLAEEATALCAEIAGGGVAHEERTFYARARLAPDRKSLVIPDAEFTQWQYEPAEIRKLSRWIRRSVMCQLGVNVDFGRGTYMQRTLLAATPRPPREWRRSCARRR